jgi:hypothetical protein
MSHHRSIRVAALALALTAVAAPAASARPDIGPPPVVQQDLSGFYRPTAAPTHKGIEARHASQASSAAPACGKDYSRNSVDGNYCPPTAATPAPATVDLRSPDARDAARGVSVHSTAPVAATSKSDGTDWGKIGIIGGSALGGLILVGLGFVLFTRRTPVLTR